jgi:hypothetical protein
MEKQNEQTIKFNTSSEHFYTVDDERYHNVSSIVSALSTKFDKDKISYYVARKEKKAQEDILDLWDIKRELAVNFGTAVHKAVELWIKYNELPKDKYLEKIVKEFPLKREGLESEKIVYCDKLKVAGTIDIVKGKELYDIKTTPELYKSYGNLLKPFDDLKDSPFNKYRIQLNTYRYLHKNINKVYILQWTDKWEVIEVPIISYKKIEEGIKIAIAIKKSDFFKSLFDF